MDDYYTVGLFTITVPQLNTVQLRLGTTRKHYLEYNFTNTISKFKTNNKLRDHLDKKINSYHDVLYLDSSNERLKLWSNSPECILRAAVYLNHLLGQKVHIQDIEQIKSKYSPATKVEIKTNEYIHIAGFVEYTIIKKNEPRYLIIQNLFPLYSDCADHEDVVEELTYHLLDSPFFENMDLDFNEDNVKLEVKSKDALLDLIKEMHRMIDVEITEFDEVYLRSTIPNFII